MKARALGAALIAAVAACGSPATEASSSSAEEPGAGRRQRALREQRIAEHVKERQARLADSLPSRTLRGAVTPPAPGVRVHLDGARANEPAQVETGADGRFELGGLAPGAYVVHADGDGVASVPMRVELGAEPAPSELAITMYPTAKLDVLVVEAGTGREIAGAEVTVLSSPLEPAGCVLRGETGAGGRASFSLPEGELYVVSVAAPGRARRTVPIQPATGTEWKSWVPLDKGTKLRGQVKTPSGRPVEGAAVRVFANALEGDERLPALLTGAGGSFEVAVDGEGPWHVQATAAGYAPATWGPLGRDEASGGIPLTLEIGGRITGTVVTRDYDPVPGAAVAATWTRSGRVWRRLVRADGAGRFTMSDLPRDLVSLVASSASAESSVLPFDLARDPEPVDAMIVVEHEETLAGVAVDHTGQPLRDAVVRARPAPASDAPDGVKRGRPPPWTRTVSTRADGTFTIPALVAGIPYEVRAVAPGLGGRGRPATGRAQPGEPVTLTIPGAGVVEGRARFADGSTPERITAALLRPGAPAPTYGPDGSFRFDGVPAGDYVLLVGGPAIPSVQRKISVSAGDATDAGIVEVEPGRELTGRVTRGGAPAHKLAVLVSTEGEPDRRYHATTGHKGEFQLAVPTDALVVRIEDGGSERTQRVAPGRGRVVVDLTLNRRAP